MRKCIKLLQLFPRTYEGLNVFGTPEATLYSKSALSWIGRVNFKKEAVYLYVLGGIGTKIYIDKKKFLLFLLHWVNKTFVVNPEFIWSCFCYNDVL